MVDETKLKSKIAEIGEVLQSTLPEGIGYALFLFEHSKEDGALYYLSNSEREGMKEVIREWLEHLDSND